MALMSAIADLAMCPAATMLRRYNAAPSQELLVIRQKL
jgi:hypothetical protein